jgi:hypothetical protein
LNIAFSEPKTGDPVTGDCGLAANSLP